MLARQDPLHVLGTGEQVRCYTHGGDLARGIATAMEHPGALNEDFNLSAARATTVRELAEGIWLKVRGPAVPLRVVHDEPFPHDTERQIAATEKAKQVLGFDATTSLDDMLDEMITWVESAIANGRVPAGRDAV